MMRARAAGYKQVDATHGGVVELRVHGVGGSPPESMLKADELVRVRGDETAGFYRTTEDAAENGKGSVREAYSWGGLTSRSWTRALWVVLAPFAFVNMSGWMIPPLPGHKVGRFIHASAEALIRVISLHTTLMVVLWFGQATIEFAAFQCGGSAACRADNSWLSMFGGSFFEGSPGRRLVVGTIGPLLLLGILWWLGRISTGRYEADYPFDEPDQDRERPKYPDTFADPSLWKRAASVSRHAHLHLAGGLSALAVVLARSVLWLYDKAGVEPDSVAEAGLNAAWIAGVVGIVAASVAVLATNHSDRRISPRQTTAVVFLGWGAFGFAMVAVMANPGVDPSGLAEGGVRLDAYGSVAATLGIGAVAAGFLLLGALLAHPNRRRSIESPLPGVAARLDAGFRSMGALYIVVLGYLTAMVALASLGALAARFLGNRPVIAYPLLYDAFAIATVVLLLVTVLIVLVAMIAVGRRVPVAALHTDFPSERAGDPDADLSLAPPARARWLGTIRRWRVVRRIVTRLDVGLSIVLTIVFIATAYVYSPVGSTSGFQDWVVDATPDGLETLAMWVLSVGLPIALFFVVRRSFSNQSVRKSVGIVWDVTTFWPRWYHPFAPPSYAGRAVPEVRTRLHVLATHDNHVVVSAHSQGSLVVLAALHGLLEADWIGNVGLVTHGSPITRLYYKFFTAHLGLPIEKVAGALTADESRPRWVNLYRLTDYIGGAIGGESSAASGSPSHEGLPDAVDRDGRSVSNPVIDPEAFRLVEDGRFPRPGDPYPLPLTHFEYYGTVPYGIAVEVVTASLSADAQDVSMEENA